MRKQNKFGIILNEQVVLNMTARMGASEVIPEGGCFVKTDGSGRMEVAGDGDSLFAGYVFPSELDEGKAYQTCSSTEGATVVTFIPIGALFGVGVRMKINSGAPTTVATMRAKYGLTCDISVSSNVQGLQAGTSAEDNVIIISGDEENFEWMIVVPNPAKVTGLTGVA